MGSCVSKKAARAGAGRKGKVAAPLPPVKEINALSPVGEEEEVKEVVLSETPAPIRLPRPPLEQPVKTKRQDLSEEDEATGSGSEKRQDLSVGSVAKEKAIAVEEQEVVKRAVVDAPEKARAGRTASPSRAAESRPKPKQGGAGNGRARSPSPSSAQRRQPCAQQRQPVPRPRREPAVVPAFGCRSGRFSPSAARRAAESAAVRRSHSAREDDMALSAKRSLSASINGGASNALSSRRDPGERSGRRWGSPTAGSKRPSPSPSPVHRQAASENLMSGTPERSSRLGVRDVVGPDDAGRGGDEQTAFAGGGKHMKPGEGALGQNPSVAMECFIFL